MAMVPLSVTLPVEVKLASPAIVEVPMSVAAFSETITLLPMISRVPKVPLPLLIVILLAPALMAVVPVMASVPLSVIAPLAVTERLAAVIPAKSMESLSTRITVSPVLVTDTELKLLPASFRATVELFPVFRVVLPVTAMVPLSVISPPALTIKAAPIVVVPPKPTAPSASTRNSPCVVTFAKLSALISSTSALSALVIATLPWKSLLKSDRSIVPVAPASRVVLPATLMSCD